MSPYNQEARAKALAYLKERGIYVMDGKFVPTDAASTDVAKTMAKYRQQVEGSRLKLMKGRK
jgi:hypothetical protein